MQYELYNGDCLEVMDNLIQQGIKVDAVITDPPYGIDYQSNRKKDKTKRIPKILNDKKPFIEFIPLLKPLLNQNGCVFIFSRWDVQQYFIDCMNNNNLTVKNVLIWDKVMHGMGDLTRSYASRYETIIFSSEKEFTFVDKRPCDIIRQQKVVELLHPNEKPVELLQTLIKQTTKENAVILDSFMGSGSTGVACVNTNRNFIGIELDKKYFEIAQKRIGKEKIKLNSLLFDLV